MVVARGGLQMGLLASDYVGYLYTVLHRKTFENSSECHCLWLYMVLA